ncbi:MAG TPA: hypothetical protein VI299_30040 [Polyangiales bacterium]
MSGALALSFLLMAACGDDSGSDGDDDNGGNQDAGSGKSDASQSSLTLDEALKTDGINPSRERAELIFPVACRNNQPCRKDDGCVDGYLEQFRLLVEAHKSDACIDSKLDAFACFATETTCANFKATCGAAVTNSNNLCNASDGGT